MFDIFWRSVAIGIGATALMDIWAIFLNKVFGQARSNWGRSDASDEGETRFA